MEQVDEYNGDCDAGFDEIFEKDRHYMIPLEKGPFYCCKQYCGAYGSLGGILIDYKTRVFPGCSAQGRMPAISSVTVIPSSFRGIPWDSV